MEKSEIIEKFIEYTLENDKTPTTVYAFSKSIEIPENEFYKHFGTLSKLENEIYIQFFEDTLSLLSESENFQNQSAREKILSFYFTFFEVLKSQRSFVSFHLKPSKFDVIEKIKVLSGLRNCFKDFATPIVEELKSEIKFLPSDNKTLHEIGQKIGAEKLWLQFAFFIKYWINDDSSDFEKTDMLIEKSLKASFDFMDFTTDNSFVDLAKFFFQDVKEKLRT